MTGPSSLQWPLKTLFIVRNTIMMDRFNLDLDASVANQQLERRLDK